MMKSLIFKLEKMLSQVLIFICDLLINLSSLLADRYLKFEGQIGLTDFIQEVAKVSIRILKVQIF